MVKREGMLLLIFPILVLAQGNPEPQDGPPPGLGGVQQSVQVLPWRNANCGGNYTGEVNLAQQPHGSGTFACSSHNYTGNWRGGVRQGRGVNTFANGDTYVGEWVNDTRHGEGELTWVTGRRYVGSMVAGRMEGKGEMTWPSGDQYIGDWENNQRSGHGLYLYSSGNRYKGQYVAGRKEGFGQFWWTTGIHAGEKFVGQFV